MGEVSNAALLGRENRALQPAKKHSPWDHHKKLLSSSSQLFPISIEPAHFTEYEGYPATIDLLFTRTLRVFSHQTCWPPSLPSPYLPLQQLRQRAPSVLIVGGGVMGLGSALHLAEAGCTVTVLEKEESVAKARKQTRAQTAQNKHSNAISPVKGGVQHQWCDALSFALRVLGQLQIFIRGKFTITWQTVQTQDPSSREWRNKKQRGTS